MSKFKQIVTNIASESKKCNYNPEIETNWDCLPMEMRNECVKWMDYRTRTSLSTTSQTEKSLVDTKKYKFDQVRLNLENVSEEWTLEPYSEKISCQIDLNPKGTDFFVSAIFGNHEIDNFCIKGDEYKHCFNQRRVPMNLVKFAPFRFKRLSIFGNSNLYFFMKNCEKLEKVDFCGNYAGCSFNLLLELPSTIKVKEFRFSHVHVAHFLEFLIGLAQKWIDIDVEVGKSMQFVLKTRVTLDVFASQFADRIIEKTDENVRIRMNNGKSQIFLRKVGSRLGWRSIFDRIEVIPIEYFSCKVIPIDMPKSEYANGDGWIQAIYEKGLEKDGKLENPVEFDAEDQAVWGDEYL